MKKLIKKVKHHSFLYKKPQESVISALVHSAEVNLKSLVGTKIRVRSILINDETKVYNFEIL